MHPLRLFLFLLLFRLSLAQIHNFQWRFTLDGSVLRECDTYQVQITTVSSKVTVVPPFYMTAYVPGGIPTTSFLGEASDLDNLQWTVDQPSGSNVLIAVYDSTGSTGGVSGINYTVVPGSSSACLPPAPSTTIDLIANVTDSLETCQPYGLRVFGGQKPYTISITAMNSQVVTNTTLGIEDDVFVYINRADPNGLLMASVFDANGVFGTSTPLISTTGSSDTTCPGLESSSGTSLDVPPPSGFTPSSPPPTPAPSSNTNSPSKSPNLVIIAVGVGVPVVVVLLGVLVGVYIWKRRRARFIPDTAITPMYLDGPNTPPAAPQVFVGGAPSPMQMTYAATQLENTNPSVSDPGSSSRAVSTGASVELGTNMSTYSTSEYVPPAHGTNERTSPTSTVRVSPRSNSVVTMGMVLSGNTDGSNWMSSELPSLPYMSRAVLRQPQSSFDRMAEGSAGSTGYTNTSSLAVPPAGSSQNLQAAAQVSSRSIVSHSNHDTDGSAGYVSTRPLFTNRSGSSDRQLTAQVASSSTIAYPTRGTDYTHSESTGSNRAGSSRHPYAMGSSTSDGRRTRKNAQPSSSSQAGSSDHRNDTTYARTESSTHAPDATTSDTTPTQSNVNRRSRSSKHRYATVIASSSRSMAPYPPLPGLSSTLLHADHALPNTTLRQPDLTFMQHIDAGEMFEAPPPYTSPKLSSFLGQ